jgi:ribosomal-protein-alanine N-acetyltransferase
LTGIVHGVFQAGYIGYSIAKSYQGQGKMKQLCRYVIDFAFCELKLNRIMANYMPDNLRSEILLKSLGFEIEGTAKSYLRINGQWEDHILTSLLNTLGSNRIINK